MPDTEEPTSRTGLALSGGGSRAAAFHCGTLRAIREVQRADGRTLADSVDVVSTVSGGSVFGGAWMAARKDGSSDDDFLANMHEELKRGFIGRSIRPRLLKTILPNYNRSNVIADTFDKIFFKGKTLKDLPAEPILVLNNTVLNNGQVGKFTREGFSLFDLRVPGSTPTRLAKMPDYPIALAVAASAAFPIGLPPVLLKRKIFSSDATFRGDKKWRRGLSLTDGGVLENLGIQTLLKSRRYGTHDLIVSDSGTAEATWERRPIKNFFRSTGVGIAGGSTLDRIMMIMNAKENRWARQQAIEKTNSSWLSTCLAGGALTPGVRSLNESFPSTRRNTMFVRVNTNWRKFFKGIPYHVFSEHGVSDTDIEQLKSDNTVEHRERLLAAHGVDLQRARESYSRLGGDTGAATANAVSTSFVGLSGPTLDALAEHAAWQVFAAHAVYGFD